MNYKNSEIFIQCNYLAARIIARGKGGYCFLKENALIFYSPKDQADLRDEIGV